MRRLAPKSRRGGFTILEVLVAMGILLVGMSAALRVGLAVLAVLIGLGYDVAVALWWCLPLVLLGWWWPAARARLALGIVALVLTAAALAYLGSLRLAGLKFRSLVRRA
mgnify:CR=1 FL=1